MHLSGLRGSLLVSMLIALLLNGCAVDHPRDQPQTDAEVQRYCRGLMYWVRSTQGRSAPIWGIYDNCLRQHSALRNQG